MVHYSCVLHKWDCVRNWYWVYRSKRSRSIFELHLVTISDVLMTIRIILYSLDFPPTNVEHQQLWRIPSTWLSWGGGLGASGRFVPQSAPTSTAQHPTLSHPRSWPAIIDVVIAEGHRRQQFIRRSCHHCAAADRMAPLLNMNGVYFLVQIHEDIIPRSFVIELSIFHVG